jgi:hypothetical protein
MIVQFVRFETSLSDKEVTAIAQARAPQFRAMPDLIQKFYLKLDKPNHYGGFYVWKSWDAMLSFRKGDLARSIPTAYKVVGAPDIDVHAMLFPLREEVALRPAVETA